jgi:carboxyl-terminal processing protease
MQQTASALRTPLLLAALLALAACTALPTRPSSGPIEGALADVAPVSSAALSPVYASEAARRKTVDTVWNLVAERFYDPAMNGVDWPAMRERFVPSAAAAANDAAFYRELKAMVAALRDSHTQVLTPRETLDRRRFTTTRVGVIFALLEGRLAITEVEPGTPAALAGVRPGDVVLATGRPEAPARIDPAFVRAALETKANESDADIAGLPAPAAPATLTDEQRVLRAVQRVLRPLAAAADRSGQPIYFELERADASVVRLTLTPDRVTRPPVAELRWLDGDVALVRFTRFSQELRPDLDRALDAAARARAVIVDLRGNGGGLLNQYRWFAGQFFDAAAPAMRELRRDRGGANAQRESEMRIGPGGTRTRPPLTQPIAVLIDARTASSAELTAVTLSELRSALLVGDRTCGCVVAVPDVHVLPDGGELRIAETGFRSMRGARMEGEPTEPAVRVTPTLADLRAGRDAVLDEAHRRVLERVRTVGAPVAPPSPSASSP